MLNKVIIEGRLVRDPELSQTQTGTHYTRCTIAVDDGPKKNKKPVFLNCIGWGKNADIICQYFTKGSPIAIVGKLIQNEYQLKDGTKRSSIELQIESVTFPVGSYRSDSQKDQNYATPVQPTQQNAPYQAPPAQQNAPYQAPPAQQNAPYQPQPAQQNAPYQPQPQPLENYEYEGEEFIGIDDDLPF